MSRIGWLLVHLANTSASAIDASTVIEGRVAAAKDVTTPIDMFLAGRLSLPIPNDQDSIDFNGVCETSTELHVVAEIPLMRALGIREKITVVGQTFNDVIFNASFDPQHDIYSSLATDYDVTANSTINATCSFQNHTGAVVNFGERAQDELCLAGIYRYPPKPPTSSSPLECAMEQNI